MQLEVSFYLLVVRCSRVVTALLCRLKISYYWNELLCKNERRDHIEFSLENKQQALFNINGWFNDNNVCSFAVYVTTLTYNYFYSQKKMVTF